MVKKDVGKSRPSYPTHKAFVVEDREEGDPFWTRVGSVFAHKDGKGYNVVLSAVPTSGRLVLREIEDEDDKDDGKKSKGQKS